MGFSPDQLHVIVPINNPVRFSSRWRLYKDFERRVVASGAHLVTVEAAFQDRAFTVTEAGNPNHVQVRQLEELWVKENLINIGVSRLPANWEYMAWVDGDIEFVCEDWPVETIHQLQHYAVAQMFQTAVDLGPAGEALQIQNGFGFSFATGLPELSTEEDFYYYAARGGKFWHPGFSWAINRQAYEDLGGLIDFAILGAGDHHMALSLIGKGHKAVPKGLHPNYMKDVMIWQNRAETHIRHDIGYVPGTILHYWHGRKQDRHYWDRWRILRSWQYNPERDIKHIGNGMITLTHEGERMRNDLRSYFRSRNEDSIDLGSYSCGK